MTIAMSIRHIKYVLIAAAALVFAPILLAQESLPQPDPVFEGKIGKTFEDSIPDFPQPVKAPEDDVVAVPGKD